VVRPGRVREGEAPHGDGGTHLVRRDRGRELLVVRQPVLRCKCLDRPRREILTHNHRLHLDGGVATGGHPACAVGAPLWENAQAPQQELTTTNQRFGVQRARDLPEARICGLHDKSLY